MWNDADPIPHTRLGQSADLIVVCPATARVLSDYRNGRSADLLTATLIATRAPVVVCPAMHTEMWEHRAVQDNITTLAARGVVIVGPESGRLAGGDHGAGRLATPEVVVAAIERTLGPRDLDGVSVLVTARDAGWVPQILAYLSGSAQAGAAAGLVQWARKSGAECLEVSEAVLAKIAARDNPQTMLGVFAQRWAELPDTASVPREAAWVALEAPRDPGNLGTIVRTADAAGAAGVILIGQSCDPYARDAVRATMGSIFNVPVVKTNVPEFLSWRAGWQGDVVGTHLDARNDFRKVAYRGPTLLAMGSEGPGLSEALVQACSRQVKIPMAGKLDSLNLAVATALVLYEVRKDKLRV